MAHAAQVCRPYFTLNITLSFSSLILKGDIFLASAFHSVIAYCHFPLIKQLPRLLIYLVLNARSELFTLASYQHSTTPI